MMVEERRERPRYGVSSGCFFEVKGNNYGATLVEVSASGAFLATKHRLALGTLVVLNHETGGRICGSIVRLTSQGFGMAFDLGEPSVTFALRTIAGNMSSIFLAD
jgi:PilZ domain